MKKSPPRAWVLATGVLFVALFAANTWMRSFAASPGQPGDRFPSLAKMETEGTAPDIAGKVVLVDLWASWCGPCKKAFPVMKELHDAFSSRGFTVLAVSLDEKKADMDEFLAKAKPAFPTLRDVRGKLAEALGVESIPTSILVGPDGRILARHEGFDGDSTKKELVAQIEKALKAAGK